MGRQRKSNSVNKTDPNRSNDKQPRIVDEINESDDEEIDEDEAFNSEDERLFGHFFDQKELDDSDSGNENVDTDDILSSYEENSEDENDDGGQHMLDLLNNLDGPDEKNDDTNMAGIPESEYSSKKCLTLENLIEGIHDTQGFKHVQASFKKEYKATTTPLAKVKSDRTGRMINYKEQAKNFSEWTRAVQENRRAETLDFKPKERLELTRDTLIDKFEATTDFEIELEQALEEAGQKDEDSVLRAEEQALQDDLGANRLTLEEYTKRSGQLAQVRALMFSYEQKRHHMKKIKSKKYRRIRKKRRERLKETAVEAALEADEDFANEFKEKEEVARIQERMTLAHKNTSKWAKRVLKRGKNVDLDTRRALSAQLKRGDDLRQTMTGKDDGSEEDEEEEDLVESARKVLAEVEDAHDPTHGNTGLFKLSFMQMGIQKQRELAKQEAQKLLSELASNERDSFNETIEPQTGKESDQKRANKVATVKEMKTVLQDGRLIATSLELGKANAISTNGGIDVDISDDEDKCSAAINKRSLAEPSTSGTREYSSTMVVNSDISRKLPDSSLRNLESTEKSVSATASASEGESNPWIQSSGEAANATTLDAAMKSRSNKRKMVDIDSSIDILDSAKKTRTPDKDAVAKQRSRSNPEVSGAKKLTSMTQEELVRKAFARPSDFDVEDDFQKEKEEVLAEDDPTRKVDKEGSREVAGWGVWTGEGALPPPSRRTLPKKLRAPIKRKEKSKRIDGSKPNIIFNQRRLKKTANTFMLGDVPHPYSSRAEYEEAVLGGVGKEWNVTQSYKSSTRPEILTRAGKIIQPISKKVKVARAPAKF